VKYLILTAALIAMSVSVMALPSGKPFIELEGMIIEVQDDVTDLQNIVDELLVDVDTLEGQVAALQTALTDLSVDVVANADAIAVIEIRLAQAESDLLMKQNIVNGVCPSGQSMTSVNVGPNDGQIVCATVNSAIDKEIINAFTFGQANRQVTGVAYCSPGYTVTGGGGTWGSGLYSSRPAYGDTAWAVSGEAGNYMGFAVMNIYAVCIR